MKALSRLPTLGDMVHLCEVGGKVPTKLPGYEIETKIAYSTGVDSMQLRLTAKLSEVSERVVVVPYVRFDNGNVQSISGLLNQLDGLNRESWNRSRRKPKLYLVTNWCSDEAVKFLFDATGLTHIATAQALYVRG